MRVIPPLRPRYKQGAPIAIHVAGGVGPGQAAGRPELAGMGFVEVFFAFPGGGDGPGGSGGTYDHRGPGSIRALADVIRFATGRTRDTQGRNIDALTGRIAPLKTNCGLIGWSHGGNACGVVMALHGQEFADLAFYASMESPYGEGAVNVELGGHRDGVNPVYDPKTGVLDLSRLAWSPDLLHAVHPPRSRPGPSLKGALYFDVDGDGRFSQGTDFPARAVTADVGQGVRAWYSPRLVREADRRSLFQMRPDHVPTLAESTAFWRCRDAASSIPQAVKKCPKLAVIVYANEKDHVQAAPDHPHILTQVEGFRRAGTRFVRLNPDRCYVERILGGLHARRRQGAGQRIADNDAGKAYDRHTIRDHLEPAGLPSRVCIQAAVCELADRVQAGNWKDNLEAVLYPDTASQTPVRPGVPRRPDRNRPPKRDRRVQDRTERSSPGKPYGRGIKELDVDAAKVVGKIRSLLGVNRGPLSWPRRPGEQTVSHVESYRELGIDFIRTHDFYGPTDWHVIFPDWNADPLDPTSYDFRSSDVRIKAIVENGFRCFYRLGTSWKGPRTQPINDPPGTRRGSNGRIVHRADRSDFTKWATICVQTIRHYTQGWKDGFRYPIEYWEIWNEPDLAAQFWTGTPEQYYTMYEEAAKAIKALDPKLKVGGPACTGGLRAPYVERFIRYCRDRNVPLDFFSWHSYGGRGGFNPYDYYTNAMRIRRTLDRHGFTKTANINTEWNAGIKDRLFSDTPAGAAFYASTLACMLDAGLLHAFQYCGDRHPGLGLHNLRTGELKISAHALAAWKRLLETPERVAATGSDRNGYNIVAGKDDRGLRLRVLVSDFQSGHDAFRLRVRNLPRKEGTPWKVRCLLLDGRHRLEVVEESVRKGRELTIERPFRCRSVCLIEVDADVEGQ